MPPYSILNSPTSELRSRETTLLPCVHWSVERRRSTKHTRHVCHIAHVPIPDGRKVFSSTMTTTRMHPLTWEQQLCDVNFSSARHNLVKTHEASTPGALLYHRLVTTCNEGRGIHFPLVSSAPEGLPKYAVMHAASEAFCFVLSSRLSSTRPGEFSRTRPGVV